MAKLTISIKGDKELQEKIRKLPSLLREKALGDALFAAAEIVKAAQANLAPRRTGAMARALMVTGLKTRLGVTIRPGPGGGRHAHLVEYGTKPHENKGRFPGTQHPGMRAQPWFGPGFEMVEAEAYTEIERRVSDALDSWWGAP